MARCILIFCFLFAPLCIATPLEDVVYKKDGSILRGTIIEQDFDKKLIKLEIYGGSIFVIPQADINKISKEPSLNSNTIDQQSTPLVAPVPANSAEPNLVTGVFYLGTSGRSAVKTSGFYETEYRFNGFNIAGQKNLTHHLAVYSDINFGKLNEGIRLHYATGEEHELNKSELDDINFSSIQLSLLLSSNLSHGWQFFTGAGKFYERFISDDDSQSFKGNIYHLGLGYSWQRFQCILRANFLSADYPEEYKQHHNGHLQLGVNF